MSACDPFLSDQEEINKRIYTLPTSHIKLNGRKSSYYEAIASLQFEECNAALRRIVPRIDMAKIQALVEGIEGISQTRKQFYKTMYEERYNKILLAAYFQLA